MKLPSVFVAALVAILLVSLHFRESWTVTEHTLEGLRNQGSFGTFLAGVLMSPVTPLVFALVAVVIAIDVWKGKREHNGRSGDAPTTRPGSMKAELQITGSGSPSAVATGGSVIQHYHLVPAPSVPIPHASQPPPSRELLPLDVDISPSEGPSDRMYLIVTNRGPRQFFRAQCRVVGRRNDPNPQQKVMFDLNWQGGEALSRELATGESANLLIASAGEDKAREMEWMQLESAHGQQAPGSRWPWPEKKKPEYDLEITILGNKSDGPKSEEFTLRAGSESALEMYRRYVRIDWPINESEVTQRQCRVSGSVGIPRAAVQTFDYAGGQWYSQGDVVVKGQAWEGLCWFGAEDTVYGEFRVVAVADGDIPKGNHKELPDRGCRSPEIQVRLRRPGF